MRLSCDAGCSGTCRAYLHWRSTIILMFERLYAQAWCSCSTCSLIAFSPTCTTSLSTCSNLRRCFVHKPSRCWYPAISYIRIQSTG